MAYGCVMSFVMRRWYVEPYQRGAGELAADGTIDLATGESILSFAWLFVYVPVGLLTGMSCAAATGGGNGRARGALQQVRPARQYPTVAVTGK